MKVVKVKVTIFFNLRQLFCKQFPNKRLFKMFTKQLAFSLCSIIKKIVLIRECTEQE